MTQDPALSNILASEIISLKKIIKQIIDEHDSYAVDDESDLTAVGNFLESFPIESLRESLEFEKPKENRQKILKKFSIPYLKEKLRLKKLYESKLEELDLKQAELKMAVINELIAKTNKLIEKQHENTTSG